MPTDAPGPSAPLAEWLRWQETLHPQAIALGLERVRAVAQRLGLPCGTVRTVTVAGTNGKGSTVALLSEIYLAAGYRVGTYSSPHLLRYNERVGVGGAPVDDAALCAAFAAVEAARAGTALTYFEFGTLAALWLFREERVDVQVLEVGLGGRLDAVNLVDADVAVVTSIGLDHQDYLGPERESIGAEKAGILRGGRAAVCSDAEPPASIGESARRVGASLWQVGREFRFQAFADLWNWQSAAVRFRKLPPPALHGAAQLRNAAGAIAAVVRLNGALPVPEAAIRAGLVRVRLPGRFERRGNVILDVAHNVEAACMLADNLRTALLGEPVRMVLGMLSDKPVEGFVRALAPAVDRIYAGGLPGPRGLTGVDLAERARGAAHRMEVFGTVKEAFERARADSGGSAPVLVCGSFMTVAAVMEVLDG